MKRWEYLMVFIPFSNRAGTANILNQFGENGWETTGICNNATEGYDYLLKRQHIE